MWVRFFLLTVFATHTLTVFERATFYQSIGIDPREYNTRVIEETNNTAARAFPLILNTNHPEFFRRLEKCSNLNLKLAEINKSDSSPIVKFCQKLPLIASIVGHLLQTYLIKPVDAESLRGTVH